MFRIKRLTHFSRTNIYFSLMFACTYPLYTYIYIDAFMNVFLCYDHSEGAAKRCITPFQLLYFFALWCWDGYALAEIQYSSDCSNPV